MSQVIATVLAAVVLLTAARPVDASDPTPPQTAAAGEVVPGEVIVKWRDAEGAVENARSRGISIVSELGLPGRGLTSLVSTKGRSVGAVVAELAADPAVAYVEPNYVVSLAGEVVAVSDPMTAGQYSLDRMRVRRAWSRSTGASNVIAVLDTGVQAGHPDLEGRVLTGYDFVNDDTRASDDNGHGTWVSGIIAANANDGYGIAGISWSDRILPVKIMNANGTGSTADLAEAIVWSADRGADVINMSVGGFPYSQAVHDAVNYAWNKGAVLVGAAGNNNRRENFYPASYDNVVSVSATQVEDEFSHWSSYGPEVDVSAPGSSVLTTNCTASACSHRDWGSHTSISGTSFATPNVSGVIALIKARYPDFTPSQVVNRLYRTVDDLGRAGREDRYGRGRVNAERALGATVAQPTRLPGDELESNDALATAVRVARGSTTDATIYPAGDEDWFDVSVPRAGRLEVRVTGVVDARAYPWNRSSLPIDPIVELYDRDGALLLRVDNEWESGTELAQLAVGGSTRVLIRVRNYYANGNRVTYTITPTFVDTVAPVATITSPTAGASEVSQWAGMTARFSEPVRNVTSSTVRLRDMETLALVPGAVSFDAEDRTVLFIPGARLEGHRRYRFELTSGITDSAGNALALTRAAFTTSSYSFRDIQGTPFATEIEWLAVRRIVGGCGTQRYCPTRDITRRAAASFLARALDLPPASRDYFTDDDGMKQEDAINRVAAAGIITGCSSTTFCPKDIVRRGQMATFLVRAFALPATAQDYFTDDNRSQHEDAINRAAAAGVMSGCGGTLFCPGRAVTREEFAAHLYRALQD